jgi:hypothetical protein
MVFIPILWHAAAGAGSLATFWRKIGFLLTTAHLGIRSANTKKPGGHPHRALKILILGDFVFSVF